AGDPIAAMGKAVDSYQQRADFLGVYRGNLSALDLLAEVSNRIDPDSGVNFETLEINRNAIKIKGISRDFEGVDRIQATLREFAIFQQIDVSDIKEASKGGGKRFNLTIQLAEEN
ncbi:MAG: PilN domain-containing protein, partial [Deltaproteobacteria bacterium]|nr:PilN domain-containing protein [Deltaproteobacteria bacterium]